MSFIQIIEFRSSRFDEVLVALDAFYEATADTRTGQGTVSADPIAPGTTWP